MHMPPGESLSYFFFGIVPLALLFAVGITFLLLLVGAPPRRPDSNEPADAEPLVDLFVDGEVETAYLLLKSAGIPAAVGSGDAFRHQHGGAGDRLMVPKSSVAQSRELLESRVAEADLIAQAESASLPGDTRGKDDSP